MEKIVTGCHDCPMYAEDDSGVILECKHPNSIYSELKHKEPFEVTIA